MGNINHIRRPVKQKPARLTVLLSREELEAYGVFVARRGGKKSSYARRLILDDMARETA